ncbi:MAG: PAS domain S-box protein [Bacteroidetes bacterium]|nr:PAS domain S-box protein [Bacteroidota bacterium]
MDKLIYEELEKRLAELEEEKTQLRIQAVYLERLFNSAPEGIIWHDNNDNVVNVNEEFTKMFGYTKEEAIGRRINDLVAPEEYREHAETFFDSEDVPGEVI